MLNFLFALGLVFVIEGIIPFAFPKQWREMLKKVIKQKDNALRYSGLFSMLIGVIILTIVRQFIE